MRVLGISDHFISGAAIVEDGRLIAAVAEERLARMKMVIGFPRKSISEVLRVAGIDASDIDRVAVASKWGHYLNEYVDFKDGVFGVDEGLVRSLFFSVGSRVSHLRSKFPLLEHLYYSLRKPAFARRRRRIREVLRSEFAIAAPVEFVSHHLAHAVGAYMGSGFDDALVVTLDGAGDGHSSHVYDFSCGRWEQLHTVPSFDSVGDYYGYVTQISGFKAGKHEGKITGLAAYGEPTYRDVLDRFIQYEGGTITNVGNTFRHAALGKVEAALPSGYSKENLAATIQQVAEDITTAYVSYWREKSGRSQVALAGGVFANVRINQRILQIPGVEGVFVYPAMSDEGIAGGAALASWVEATREHGQVIAKCFDHVYLGPDFSKQEIADALAEGGVEYSAPEALELKVAQLISEGWVVARVAGRMEYGPRALGNRSILYRPDEPDVNDWLNERLGRTEFMPFAPAMLAEDADDYFLGLDGGRDTARFMTMTFDCTDLMKLSCPGVVHVDGTARPQLVSESDNPTFYQILQEFKRLTGLPCVVNTSFNIHEEPIVCTPRDAIRAFKKGHLDALAIGPFLAVNNQSDRERRMRADVESHLTPS